MTRRAVLVVAGAAVLLLGAILLYSHDPEKTTWSPKCIILMTTGYKCPGCGIQRMVYHLMHGEVLTAIKYNYFAAFVLPLAAVWGACSLSANKVCIKVRNILESKTSGFLYIGLYFFWWIFRNVMGL